MTTAQLLSKIFNLGAQTPPFATVAAARDFWLIFGAVIVGAAVYLGLRATQHRQREHTHPFGHSFLR